MIRMKSKVHQIELGQRNKEVQKTRNTTDTTGVLVQQPSRHFSINLAKLPPNQVIADFGRGSSVES